MRCFSAVSNTVYKYDQIFRRNLDEHALSLIVALSDDNNLCFVTLFIRIEITGV